MPLCLVAGPNPQRCNARQTASDGHNQCGAQSSGERVPFGPSPSASRGADGARSDRLTMEESTQIVAQLARRLVPLFYILLKALKANCLHVPGNTTVQPPRCWSVLKQDLVKQQWHVATKWYLSGE